MINLSNGTNLKLGDNLIREIRDPESDLTKPVSTWSLAHLELIVTTDSLADDKKRKAIEYKKRQKENAIVGAVVGGMLDGSDADDSILDGLLLGAAFGAVATSGPEKPMAKVGLVFSDGNTLSVKVNSKEYSRLQSIAARNAKNGKYPKNGAVRKVFPTKDDMDGALKVRAITQLKKYLIAGFVIALGTALVGAWVSSVHGGGQGSNNEAEIFGAFAEFVKIIPYLGVAFGLILTTAGFVGVFRPETLLRSEEEDRYASVSPAYREKKNVGTSCE
jgi:outer membrane lipoprotein SlyB